MAKQLAGEPARTASKRPSGVQFPFAWLADKRVIAPAILAALLGSVWLNQLADLDAGEGPAAASSAAVKSTAVPDGKKETAAAPVACPSDDAVCIGKRELSAAAYPCREAVEGRLAYRHEWTDKWYEEKFDRVMWYEPTSTIIYHGDKLQAQNGFGAWKKMSYFCVWSVAGKSVIKAGINE